MERPKRIAVAGRLWAEGWLAQLTTIESLVAPILEKCDFSTFFGKLVNVHTHCAVKIYWKAIYGS